MTYNLLECPHPAGCGVCRAWVRACTMAWGVTSLPRYSPTMARGGLPPPCRSTSRRYLSPEDLQEELQLGTGIG